jgi:hypothetical protein
MSEPQLPPHLRSRITATPQATALPAASALSDQQQQQCQQQQQHQQPAAPAAAPAAAADVVQGISALPADALAQLARSMQPVVRDGKVIGFNMPSHLLSAAAAPAQAAASAPGSTPAAQQSAQAAGQAAAGGAAAHGYLTAAASAASPGHPVAATHQQQKPSRLEENPMVQTLLAAIGATPLQATASAAAAGSAGAGAAAGAGSLPHAWSGYTDASLQAQHSLPAMASTNLAGPAAPAPVAVSGYGGPISGYSAAQQPSSAAAPAGTLPQHVASTNSVLAWQPLAAPAAAAGNQPAARWNAVISTHSTAAHAAPPPSAAAALGHGSAHGHEPMVRLGASTQAQPQHEPMTRIPVSSIRPGAGPYPEPHHAPGASSSRKRERSPGRADSPGRPQQQQHVAEPAGPGGAEARQDSPAAGQQAGAALAARGPRLGLQAHTCTQYKQLPAELAELVDHLLAHHAGLLRPEAFGEPSVRRALEAVHQANAHSAVSILQQLLRYDRARLLGVRDLRGYIVAACKRSMEEMGRCL